MEGEELNPAIRRRGVLSLGVVGVGVAGLGATAVRAPAAARPPVLTAQTTEGPYYFDVKLMRRDITEGLAGVPLEVRFNVLDEAGRPFAGARVDIWHCDATGVYSGYADQGEKRHIDTRGQTFLRGNLNTDADGVAAFRSVYPGWYEGRTTHIHFKVLNGTRAVLTSQFFLPDVLSEFLYTQLPDYRRGRVRETLNSNDGIAIEAGQTVLGAIRQESDCYVASLTVVADRAANPVVERPPVPGDGPPPGLDRTGGPPPPRGSRPLEGNQRLSALVPGNGSAVVK